MSSPSKSGPCAKTLQNKRRCARRELEIYDVLLNLPPPGGPEALLNYKDLALWKDDKQMPFSWQFIPASCDPCKWGEQSDCGASMQPSKTKKGKAKAAPAALESDEARVARGRRKQLQVESFAVVLQQLARAAAAPLHVVDFGCGTGALVLPLAALMPDLQFTGVDMKPAALEILAKRASAAGLTNVNVWRGMIEHYSDTFDVALALHACGNATDVAMLAAAQQRAAIIVSPCCVGKLKFSLQGGNSFSASVKTWTPQRPGDRPGDRALHSSTEHQLQTGNGTIALDPKTSPSTPVPELNHPRSQWLTRCLPDPSRHFGLMAKLADIAHSPLELEAADKDHTVEWTEDKAEQQLLESKRGAVDEGLACSSTSTLERGMEALEIVRESVACGSATAPDAPCSAKEEQVAVGSVLDASVCSSHGGFGQTGMQLVETESMEPRCVVQANDPDGTAGHGSGEERRAGAVDLGPAKHAAQCTPDKLISSNLSVATVDQQVHLNIASSVPPGTEIPVPITKASVTPGTEIPGPITKASVTPGTEIPGPITKASVTPGTEIPVPSTTASVISGAEITLPNTKASVTPGTGITLPNDQIPLDQSDLNLRSAESSGSLRCVSTATDHVPASEVKRAARCKLAKVHVELDRVMAAREAGYAAALYQVFGAESMAKGDMIVALPLEDRRWKDYCPLLGLHEPTSSTP